MKEYHLYSYYSVKDFLEANLSLDKSTPIYVDSDLGEGLKGEVLSEVIYKNGSGGGGGFSYSGTGGGGILPVMSLFLKLN